MNRTRFSLALLAALLCAAATPARAQWRGSTPEWTASAVADLAPAPAPEAVLAAGRFTPRWTIYGALAGAALALGWHVVAAERGDSLFGDAESRGVFLGATALGALIGLAADLE